MRLLNTLYVTDDDVVVKAKSDALEVRRQRMLVARFPLHGLEAVVVTGRAEMTTEALTRCARHKIPVVALHRSGRLRFQVRGATSGNVLLRLSQLRAADTPARSLVIARTIVAGKLQNQRRLVQRWAWNATGLHRAFLERQADVIAERLTRLPSAPDGDTVRGIEGDAARRYFKALGSHLERANVGITFITRTRRPPRDPANALLSYLYGVGVAEIAGAVEATGLDPQVGFLHGVRPGRPALALDLVEELRTSLDRFAVGLLTRRQMNVDDFTVLPGGAVQLSDDGRRKLLGLYEAHRSEDVRHQLLTQPLSRALLPSVQATILARHLRGDLPHYVPYVMEA